MTREEHLRAITVVGTVERYKRLGLLMLCSGPDCGGAELFADGLSAAAVATAADGHVAQYAGATSSQDGCGFTAADEAELSDIVAAARLAGWITGTGRFSRAILGAGYRRTQPPSPCWELREEFAELHQSLVKRTPAEAKAWLDALNEPDAAGEDAERWRRMSHELQDLARNLVVGE